MRRVTVESPYAGDVDKNVKYAQECLKDSLRRGEAPLASHLLYTQVLDDTIPEERTWGINAGFEWLEQAEACILYIDNGISNGMRFARAFAQDRGIPVEYRLLYTSLYPPKPSRNDLYAFGHDLGTRLMKGTCL